MAALLHQITLSSPTDMTRLGQRLAPKLQAGDCLCLKGQIGAGKSVLSRAIIQSLLDVPEDVPSPTFTLVQIYETARFDIWHCDLYRLTDPSQIDELGLEEALPDSLCLIEWPEIMGTFTPQSALTVEIAVHDDTRALKISGDPTLWTCRLEGIL